MATVYKALDQILNRYVAVKILRDEFTTDDEFIKDLMQKHKLLQDCHIQILFPYTMLAKNITFIIL